MKESVVVGAVWVMGGLFLVTFLLFLFNLWEMQTAQVRDEVIMARLNQLQQSTRALVWFEEYEHGKNIKKIKKYLGTETADYDMEYDSYGNLTKVTQPASINTQRMFYTYSYDPVYHTYLLQTTDAYGYTSTTQYDNNYL